MIKLERLRQGLRRTAKFKLNTGIGVYRSTRRNPGYELVVMSDPVDIKENEKTVDLRVSESENADNLANAEESAATEPDNKAQSSTLGTLELAPKSKSPVPESKSPESKPKSQPEPGSPKPESRWQKATVKTRQTTTAKSSDNTTLSFPKLRVFGEAINDLSVAYINTLGVLVLGGAIVIWTCLSPDLTSVPSLGLRAFIILLLSPLVVTAVYHFLTAIENLLICAGSRESAEQFERLRQVLNEKLPIIPFTKTAKICRWVRLADLLFWGNNKEEADKLYENIASIPRHTWSHARRTIQPTWFAEWLQKHNRYNDADYWLKERRRRWYTIFPIMLCNVVGLAIGSYFCQLTWDYLSCIIYNRNGQTAHAEKALEAYRSHVESILGPTPSTAYSQILLAITTYCDRGTASKATPYLVRYAEAVSARTKHPSHYSYRQDQVNALSMLATWQAFAKDPGAKDSWNKAVSAAESTYGPNNSAVVKPTLALAAYLRSMGELTEAESLIRKCLVIADHKKIPAQSRVSIMSSLTENLMAQNKLKQAEAAATKAIAFCDTEKQRNLLHLAPIGLDEQICKFQLATILTRTQRINDAIALLTNTLSDLEEVKPDETFTFPEAQSAKRTGKACNAQRNIIVGQLISADDIAESPVTPEKMRDIDNVAGDKSLVVGTTAAFTISKGDLVYGSAIAAGTFDRPSLNTLKTSVFAKLAALNLQNGNKEEAKALVKRLCSSEIFIMTDSKEPMELLDQLCAEMSRHGLSNEPKTVKEFQKRLKKAEDSAIFNIGRYNTK